MTFEIYRTSGGDINYPGITKKESGSFFRSYYNIVINSLRDLDKLERYFGEKLIISMKYKTIEIYDEYRE